MGKKSGVIVDAKECAGELSGFKRPIAAVRLEDDSCVPVFLEAVSRTNQGTERLGPTGDELKAEDLRPGVEVVVDVRKRQVDKLLNVSYPDDVQQERKKERREAGKRHQRNQRAEARERERNFAYEPDGATNPYTFLPYVGYTPDDGFQMRPAHRTAPRSDGQSGPRRQSGWLLLRLNVASPLATYGGSTLEDATHSAGAPGQPPKPAPKPNRSRTVRENKHHSIRLLLDAGNQPTLTGAAVKGAIRTWLEVITSSSRDIDRSGVAWRVEGLRQPSVGIMRLFDEKGNAKDKPICAHKLDRAPEGLKAYIVKAGEVPVTAEPPPADRDDEARVTALWREWKPIEGPPRLTHGMVVQRRQPNGDQPTKARLQVGVGAVGKRPVSVRLLGDADAGGNLQELPSEPGRVLEVSPEAMERWWLAHRHGGPNERREGHRTVLNTREFEIDGEQVSCVPPDARELYDGLPVFYEQQAGEIVYLSPIRGGRAAVSQIEERRIPWPSAPQGDDQLDPARRIFGRVPEARPSDEDDQSAWAGRVRIARISYEGNATTECFTIRPLASPKVQSAGYYLSTGNNAAPTWQPNGSGKLAGTKIYWHQVPIPNADDEVNGLAERVRKVALYQDHKGDPAKTPNNTTVEALLDGSFDVEIWFEDLTDTELDALLLATDLGFKDDDARRGFKLGQAKPLGFGSVQNELREVSIIDEADPTQLQHRLLDGDAIKQRLANACRHWLSDAKSTITLLADVADLDAVRARSFGYDHQDNHKAVGVGAAEVLGLERPTGGRR